MKKNNLSIIALIIQVISIFLLYIDGIFKWGYINSLGRNTYLAESFNWLFDTQYGKGVVVWLVVVLIIMNIIVQILPLFKKCSFIEKKYMILLPIAVLVTFIICCMWGEANIGQSIPNYDMLSHMERPWVDFGILFYVEAVLMSASVLIEALKRFSKISE